MEEPKKVNVTNIFVAKGDWRDRIAFEIELSNPLSCSSTISSAIVTNTKSERINNRIANIKRRLIHFAIVCLNPEFSNLKILIPLIVRRNYLSPSYTFISFHFLHLSF